MFEFDAEQGQEQNTGTDPAMTFNRNGAMDNVFNTCTAFQKMLSGHLVQPWGKRKFPWHSFATTGYPCHHKTPPPVASSAQKLSSCQQSLHL